MSTLGQYRVFSNPPSENKDVQAIHNGAAQWIDFLDQFAQRDNIPAEAKRLLAKAADYVEVAAMISAKAVTKGPRA